MPLHKWPLPKVDLAEGKFDKAPRDWTLAGIPELDERLKECKSRIDAPYNANPERWETLTILLEPSRAIRDTMRTRFDAQNVTNAWLKLIEIFAAFNLLPGDSPVKMFDNASAPGAFIMAAHYWTKCVRPAPFTWKASTWIADSYVALGDNYGLIATYPERYTTYGTKFNGDTMDTRYLRYMEQTHGGEFTLYTSDLGMRIPDGKYNCQEAVNARGNLGQVLMGLLTLAPGGVLVTKQFSHMSSFTASLMAIVAAVFDDVHIVKPLTSKPDNSEEYLVGRGFRGLPNHLRDIMYDALDSSIDGWDIERLNFLPPLLPRECISSDFEKSLLTATKDLVGMQCAKIAANIREYEWMVAHRTREPRRDFTTANLGQDVIEAWIALAPFKRMDRRTDYIQASAPKVLPKYTSRHHGAKPAK